MLKEQKSKRVCIIRSNPVNPDSRVEKEAWTLKKAGYDVCILAWDRSSDIRQNEGTVTVGDMEIPIVRLGYKSTYGEGFKNLISYLKFQFAMRKWLKKHDFDIIHACDFDTAFFARGTVKKNQRFIFDIFDFLYGEPHNFLQKSVKKMQISLINRADATIICTEDRKRQILKSKPKRLAVVHNTPISIQIGDEIRSLETSGNIKIVYVGILQDFRLLKEIAAAVSELPGVELHIGGFGKYEEYFAEMSEKFQNIIFYGKLSYDRTLALEKECDIMLAVYDPSIENHKFAAPNKFYESLMLGKPVIMARGTGMSDIIEKNNTGVLIEYSKKGFCEGLNCLIEQKLLWPDMSEKMVEIYNKDYNWDIMSRRLIELYGELSE